jgi:hypothetical protein
MPQSRAPGKKPRTALGVGAIDDAMAKARCRLPMTTERVSRRSKEMKMRADDPLGERALRSDRATGAGAHAP